MKHLYKIKLFILLVIGFFFINGSCSRQPYEPDYYTAIGYVIEKETCNTDVTKDFWLIDIISSSSVRQQYGETIVVNGTQYTNVVKSTGLTENLKNNGQKIGMDFYLSGNVVETTNCEVAMPKTYSLKVAQILNVGEAR